VTLASCATTPKQEKLTEAVPLHIQGTYDGRADIENNLMRVTVSSPKMENLSSYRNVRPLTGGNHVLVYFDTDPEIEGAEYAAFIYSDEISFRKRDMVDWYIQELTTISYELKGGDIRFDVPLKYFDYKPFKAWTQRVDS
jgi:hypothetical protein